MFCEVCESLITGKAHKHHVKPRSEGGRKGQKVLCCAPCNTQVHMLFTNKELAKMTFQELLKTPAMRKWIAWRRKHPSDVKHRMSRRIK